MEGLPTTPKRVRAATLSGRGTARTISKRALTDLPTTSTRRPVADSVRVLVRHCLVIFLGLINLAMDGPVSWWGFDELTLALQRSTGYAWNAPAEVKWYLWIAVTIVSTLSLAHFTLNWKSYGRSPRAFLEGVCFVLLILVPSQVWDFVDSTAGIYGLFQPISLTAINPLLLYGSIVIAILASFVAPTFAVLLARQGHDHATPQGDQNGRR